MAKVAKNFIGKQFGRLIIVHEVAVPLGARRRVVCECTCGGFKETELKSVIEGLCKSCGCLHKESCAEKVKRYFTKHGNARNGKATVLYKKWLGIKRRCFNSNTPGYKDYGARGITLHPEWIDDFPAFRAYVESELGLQPDKHYSLDRIDNNGNYEPGNLRWADPVTQTNNRRNTVRVVIGGVQRALADLAREARIHPSTLAGRIKRKGMDIESALTWEGRLRKG